MVRIMRRAMVIPTAMMMMPLVKMMILMMMTADVNECFLDQTPCQQLCNNTDGSYECGCFNSGFRLSWDHSTCAGKAGIDVVL